MSASTIFSDRVFVILMEDNNVTISPNFLLSLAAGIFVIYAWWRGLPDKSTAFWATIGSVTVFSFCMISVFVDVIRFAIGQVNLAGWDYYIIPSLIFCFGPSILLFRHSLIPSDMRIGIGVVALATAWQIFFAVVLGGLHLL
ncbi:MAG: hypothetical protein ABI230_13770 [Aestuariivirga sp.]